MHRGGTSSTVGWLNTLDNHHHAGLGLGLNGLGEGTFALVAPRQHIVLLHHVSVTSTTRNLVILASTPLPW